MTTEEKYVAAAYLVVFLFVLLYVVIMAAKLSRLMREVSELADRVRRRPEGREGAAVEHEEARRGVGVG